MITPGEHGANAIARLLAAVRDLQLPHAHSSAGAQVSLSLGAADLRPDKGLSMTAALERVDALLYEAKRGGRARARHLRIDQSEPVDVFAEE